ncbi:MAG: thioredoxin family protein [Saprospiraceae bacterium]|nr:thioredoxin family protein [Saprospiraceae bacterium]
MSLTESKMLELGVEAPNFILPDTISGRNISYEEVSSDKKGTLVMFICNHCPYVLHVIEEVKKLTDEYMSKGIGVVAISSNDVKNYPADSPEKMKEFAAKYDLNFPYLYDESQNVARAYDAACTPDFYLFDEDDKLIYRGRLDGSRPNNDEPLTGKDLRDALDRLLDGRPQSKEQYPSAGCNIKWKNN